MTSYIINPQKERQKNASGRRIRQRKLAYLKPVSSLRTLSSSEEGALLGLREAFLEGFLDECREDAADDWDRAAAVVAFTPSKNSLLAAFREVVLPPPRARRRRSIWSSRFFERGFRRKKKIWWEEEEKKIRRSRSSRDV